MEDREDIGTEDVEAHSLLENRAPTGDDRAPTGDDRAPTGDDRAPTGDD
ncbi:MAG: hypothetical protein ACXWZP_00975 [Gaiellaceae bacterium]